MNASEPKPEKEVLDALTDAKKVFIVACTGCPVGCDVGGQPWVDATSKVLEGASKTVTGSCLVEMLCNKALVGVKLGRFSEPVLAADAILVRARLDRRTLPDHAVCEESRQRSVWRHRR